MTTAHYVYHSNKLWHFNLDDLDVIYAAVSDNGRPYVDVPLDEVPDDVLDKLYAKITTQPKPKKRLFDEL